MFRGDQQKRRPTGPESGPSGHADDWEELAVDFIDGRLDPHTTAAIESHLDECPECAARLRTQRAMIGLLQETPLQDPPFRLEDRVLDQVLAPTPPRRTTVGDRVEEPRWSLLWRRKLRPWVPATIGVAAVFLAIVGYGLLRPGGEEDLAQYEGTTTVAYSNAETAADSREGQATVGVPAAETATTAAPMTTMTASAEATTTTAGGTLAVPPEETAVVAMAAAGTQDRRAMIANLEETETPAYFVFDATALEDEDSAEKATVSVVDQIIALTGLLPLEDTLALDGPTFAAFVPRDDAVQLVDLLQSIGASVQLTVSMEMQPPDKAAQTATRLVEQKDALPELSARRTQPAVAGWTFTTSTLVESTDGSGGTGQAPLDEAGTHVLVVIYLHD